MLLSGMCCATTDRFNGVSFDEEVVMIASGSGPSEVKLETTIFAPLGKGPFPLVILNHGKSLGNPHLQARDRFLVLSSEFVKRGYAVIIPMRKGFAKSTGDYVESKCDMTLNGQIQANDLLGTLAYLQRQSWADTSRMIVAGQSYGGLTTMAFGTRQFPGVKGLINFAGGLRVYGGSCAWQSSLVKAFSDYGGKTAIPSIWFYGMNDSHFNPQLASDMYSAYVTAGGKARLVAYGAFQNDAHGMIGSRDGVKIWWPETEKFLQQIGMPTGQTPLLVEAEKSLKVSMTKLDVAGISPQVEMK